METLSSRLTLPYKLVFAPLVIVGTAILALVFVAAWPLLRWEALIGVAVCAVLTTWAWWTCLRLKRVRLDGDTLFVSNYINEIRVPLSELESVVVHRFTSGSPVTMTFRTPTAMGHSVRFIPKLARRRTHDALVARLQSLARRTD